MAVATAPGSRASRRSLLGMVVSVVQSKLKPRKAAKLGQFAAAVREHTMTIAALAAADLGAFQVWHHGGWFALAASIVLLDFAVTGR